MQADLQEAGLRTDEARQDADEVSDLRRSTSAASVTAALLVLFLATDGIFIALHLVQIVTHHLQDYHFSVEMDWGYGEIFQLIKETWTFGLLAALGLRTRRPVYGAWSLVYGYVLFDDALQVHERLGGKILELLSYAPAFHLRAQDFGEATVTAVAGLGLAVPLVVSFLRSSAGDRRVSRNLAGLLALLFLFGVVVDMLHVVTGGLPLMGLLEDGGEMLVMSLTCWYVFRLFERRPRPG